MGDYKAAIIGLGVVGRAQVRLFGDMVHATYDPAHHRVTEPYPFEKINSCDFAVICVGTPQRPDGRANLSYLREALDRIPPELPVLIRSTIPPGTMAALEKSRSLVAHLPEFLNERPDGAWRESRSVPFMILGGIPAVHEFFLPVLAEITTATVYCCPGLEAELVKYTANAYLAAKVTFVNEMARVCETLDADWDRVRLGWLHDPRTGSSHTQVEGPGFGGRCLPKDLSALIHAAEDAGYNPGFLRAIQDANARYKRGAANEP